MIFNRPISCDFAVVDSSFPQKTPLGFRNTEINEYFKKIKNCQSYTSYPMLPGKEAWFTHGYGVTKAVYKENMHGYLLNYPENKKNINLLNPKKLYSFKLAYSYFLAETYVFLPFYEKHKIPFVFVLYLGGSFGINNKGSDNMLRKIFSSKYFRGVIVTQKLTKEYLINKSLCGSKQIHYIYGGFVQFNEKEVLKRRYFDKDKDTLDLCFVAAKYSKKGIDKGYDAFIETAKILSKTNKKIRYHVVGGFDETDIDITSIVDQITFYGYMTPDKLPEFYQNMDILLSPSRSSVLYKGNFDGFPLGIDAGYCGVSLFVTDKLKMNYVYKKNEIEIITPNPKAISQKVVKYYENPTSLLKLSKLCQKRTQELFNVEAQINKRMGVFKKYANIETFR